MHPSLFLCCDQNKISGRSRITVASYAVQTLLLLFPMQVNWSQLFCNGLVDAVQPGVLCFSGRSVGSLRTGDCPGMTVALYSVPRSATPWTEATRGNQPSIWARLTCRNPKWTAEISNWEVVELEVTLVIYLLHAAMKFRFHLNVCGMDIAAHSFVALCDNSPPKGD